ncbi:MAG: LytR C-terminal domain-containing protein, partial [Anaerolineae bacterium]
VFADTVARPSPEEVTRQAIQAEAARIIVLNGTQEKGLATRMQANLITAGFNVVAVGNADRTDYAETWLVTHGENAPATLETLAAWFKVPPERIRSEPKADEHELTLIIGQDQVAPAPEP